MISWWEERLRGEAALLLSLTYFKPMFMSLAFPHPMWTMAESPLEVRKACTVASILSGRYVTNHRARHCNVTPTNSVVSVAYVVYSYLGKAGDTNMLCVVSPPDPTTHHTHQSTHIVVYIGGILTVCQLLLSCHKTYGLDTVRCHLCHKWCHLGPI